MANNDTKALKSGIWYIISNFVVKGAVFLSTPIFTRLMTKEEIGDFSNIGAWIQILLIITSLELATSITLGKFEYPGKLNEFVSSVLILSTIISCLSYAIVLIFNDFFMNLFKVDFVTLNIMFWYCIFSHALEMLQIKNRVLFEYKFSTFLSFISVILSIAVSLILVICFENKYFGRVIGYYGFLIFFNIILFFYILRLGKFSTKYWKFAISISIPMMVHAISGQLLSTCDRIMIMDICGSSKNALYSVAYTLATVLTVLWSSLHNAWSPWAYEQMDNEKYERLKRASKPYIILFFVAIMGFLLITPELMYFMGGKEYSEAIWVLPPVVVGILFQFVYSIYVNVEFFYKKQRLTAIGTTAAAALNLLLNWIFIPIFGYIAAAFTTLIGYIALFFIHYYIVRQMGKSWWFDTKFNFLILGGAIGAIPILFILYIYPIIRFCVIGFLAILLLVICIRYKVIFKQCIKEKSIKPITKMLNI